MIHSDTLLMTGASGALGQATLARLPESVRHAILIGRDFTDVRSAANYLAARNTEITYLQCDLSSREARKNLIQQLSRYKGQVTMMVHAAGLSWPCGIGDFSSKFLEEMLQINALAFADLAYWSIEQFDRDIGGHIVAVSSTATLYPGQEHMLIAASKGCLEQLVRCWAAAYVRKKVTVNAVLPGAMASSGGDAYRKELARIAGKSVAEILEERFRHLPTDDLISPVEVADAIVGFLAQPGFARTGNLLRVSGGKF